jgi:hypothetical protein
MAPKKAATGVKKPAKGLMPQDRKARRKYTDKTGKQHYYKKAKESYKIYIYKVLKQARTCQLTPALSRALQTGPAAHEVSQVANAPAWPEGAPQAERNEAGTSVLDTQQGQCLPCFLAAPPSDRLQGVQQHSVRFAAWLARQAGSLCCDFVNFLLG